MSPAQLRNLRTGLAGLFALFVTVKLFAEIEWRGTIVRNGAPTFALTDTATGASKWVPMGATFSDFQVTNYDGQRQLLVLVKGGVRTELTVASSRVTAPAKPAGDDLKNLSGLPLAEELAKRGDTNLRDQLAQLRTAQVSREEIGRRLAEAERLPQGPPPSASRQGPSSGARANTATLESARDELRSEAQRADEEIARRTAQIEKAAKERRGAGMGPP